MQKIQPWITESTMAPKDEGTEEEGASFSNGPVPIEGPKTDAAPVKFRGSGERALRAKPAGEAARHAKCTAFFPANGGCGNTTLAIQTAFLLGSRKKQLDSICLVDLNFKDGAVADYLDLSPAF